MLGEGRRVEVRWKGKTRFFPGRIAIAHDNGTFDVAYDDVLRRQVDRGGDLVSVQPRTALFLGTAQLEQQWQVARARARELGRSVVVSSVNGISGAIAPDGSVLERLPVRVAGAIGRDVPLKTSQTGAVRLGAAPLRLTWVIISMALLVTLAQDRRARRRRRCLPPTRAGSPPAMPLGRSDTT